MSIEFLFVVRRSESFFDQDRQRRSGYPGRNVRRVRVSWRRINQLNFILLEGYDELCRRVGRV